MARKATLVRTSDDGKTSIYIDELNAAEIFDYIQFSNKRIRRWEYILSIVMARLQNDCIKREVVEGVRDVLAMRFDLHDGNGRIYCKQINRVDRSIIIVASELHPSKKSESLGHKELAMIMKVNGYHYDI